MSKRELNIKEALNRRFKSMANNSFFAFVKEVDEKKRICSVRVGELIYDDVLLYAQFKENLKGFHFVPKIGSQVVVSRLQGTDNLFISQYSVVDKLTATIGEKVSIEIDDTALSYINDKCSIRASAEEIEMKLSESVIKATDKGLTFVKGSNGLLKTLEALCDAIAKLTVSTAVGPSSPPINLADFNKIKTELKNYLEG